MSINRSDKPKFKRVMIPGVDLMSKRALSAVKSLGLEAGIALSQESDAPLWTNEADFVSYSYASSDDTHSKSFSLVGAALDAGCDALLPTWSEREQALSISTLSAASRLTFIGGNPDQLSTINNRVGVRWAASDLNMDVVTTSEKIQEYDDAMVSIANLGFPLVMRTFRAPSQRLFNMEDAQAALKRALPEGPIIFERLVPEAREIETVMFALGDELPICLGECELTVRLNQHRSLSEYPPLGLSESRLRRMRAQAAQLIFGTGWKGIISARFLVTPDDRAYFLQLNPGLQPWHASVEHAIGVDLMEAMVRVSHGEELGWGQTDVRYNGHTISLLIHSNTNGRLESIVSPDVGASLWGADKGDVVKKGQLVGMMSFKGKTRQSAIVKAKVASDQLAISGIVTNQSEMAGIFDSNAFWVAPLRRDISQKS